MKKTIDPDAMSNLLDGLTSGRPSIGNTPFPSPATVVFSKEESTPKTTTVQKNSGKERICTTIDKTVMNKIRVISEKEGVQINELISLGLDMLISKYEETHGQVRPKKENRGDINNIFR